MTSDGLPEGYPSAKSNVVDLQTARLFERINIIGTREGGFTECFVPADLIDYEEVPVKEEWARSLSIDMREKAAVKGGTGQMAPIVLGHIPGESSLKIIDGFHRDAALRINDQDLRFATIVETNWDELYDERIFLAKDHVHVRFSRVVQWICEAWQYTGLTDKLSVEQAVLLYRYETDGTKLGIDPEDVEAAKAWVARKEDRWQMASMTMRSHLKIAEHVDPQLVHSTREKRNGKELDAPTQVIIKTFSDVLPGNFAMQNFVMDAAKQHNLKGPQVKAACKRVANCKSIQEAEAAVEGYTWEADYAEDTKRAMRRAYDPRFKGAVVLSTTADILGSIDDRIIKSIQDKEPVDPAMRSNLIQTRAAAEGLARRLGGIAANLTTLIGDGRERQQQPAAARTEALSTSRPMIHNETQSPAQTKAFQTLLRAYMDGRIEHGPPITSRVELEYAESLVDLYALMHSDTKQTSVMQNKIAEARDSLTRNY